MILLYKNGIDFTSSVDMKSLRGRLVLTKQVSTLTFNIKNYGGKMLPSVGDQIDLYLTADHVFGGTITQIADVNSGGNLVVTQVTCTDWSFRLNSKLVVKTYANMDPRDIIIDILNTFTDGTYTYANVDAAGFNVSSIKFNYEQVTIAIEKLAKMIGWEWYVDADKDVHFFSPVTSPDAPFGIDQTNGKIINNSLVVSLDLTNLKNSISVVGGTYQKNFTVLTTPDVYQTDGIKQIFPIGYSYTAASIVVELAGVAQTVGIDQVTDPGSVQVLYNEASRFIKYTSVPTTGQTTKIYGDAQIPILVHSQNNSSVAAYGEVQDVIIDPTISSIEEAQERALAQLALYGTPVYNVTFDTLEPGLEIGQRITLTYNPLAPFRLWDEANYPWMLLSPWTYGP